MKNTNKRTPAIIANNTLKKCEGIISEFRTKTIITTIALIAPRGILRKLGISIVSAANQKAIPITDPTRPTTPDTIIHKIRQKAHTRISPKIISPPF